MDFHKELMNTATIRNEEFLEILEDLVELVAKKINFEEVWDYGEDQDLDWFTSPEYLQQLVDKGQGHNGFPEILVGVSTHIGDGEPKRKDDALWHQIQMDTQRLNHDLQCFIGSGNRALTAVYPPGGGIAWHNNANASAYNVILTWSETGDGYWEHIEPKTKKHVRIQDQKGWQCKYGYFGSYQDGPHTLCYHKARTNCLRMSLGFTFNRDETGKKMAEMLIEEIETA